MKTIVIDREIPMALFCKAFRHHVESNTLANETVKSGDSFWYGEIHEDGEFEMGYHFMETVKKHGTYIGTRKSEIRGKVTCEKGKTTIQYSRTLAGWLPIVLIPLVVGIALASGMISEYKAQGDLYDFLPALFFVPIFAVLLYNMFPRYNRKLSEKFQTIIRECKGALDMGFEI